MSRRDRYYEEEPELKRRGSMWDEDEYLADQPPFPERVGHRVRRASREIGDDVSREVEKMGSRLRGWSEEAGKKAERAARDLGDGIERAGKAGRRWIADRDYDDDYERALYDVDYDRVKKLDKLRDREEEKARRKLKKKDKKYRDRREDIEDRFDEIGDEVRSGADRLGREAERGWSSWWGWSKKKERRSIDEDIPEERTANMQLKARDIDVVCIDSSMASAQAFRYALRNVPRGHSLLLVHGIFTPPGAIDSKVEDEREMIRSKRKFMSLCKQEGRHCVFRDFEYTNNNELGEIVCSIAERQGAGSVILGQKASTSEMRRAMLGSPSVSVMQHCNVPVTLINERKESDLD